MKLAAGLAVVLLLSTPYIARYGISARADMVALLLAFAGFFIFYCHRESRMALVFAAVLMLFSFFYKQQFIGAPLSVFAYLIISKRFGRALGLGSMMLGGWLTLTGAFTFLIFRHQEFLLHFITYNRLPFEKSLVLPEILMFVIPLFVPLLGSVDFVDQYPDKLVACYALISAGGYFLLLLSSGSGADTNRCLEAAVVLSCLLAARITTSQGILSGFAWTGALALTLTLVALLGSAFVIPRVTRADFATDAALQNYLRESLSAGTSVLSYYPADPLRAKLEVPVTNWWHYSALIRKGTLSDRDIVSRIDRGGYGAILLDFDVTRPGSAKMADFYTTKAMRDALLRSYAPAARLTLPIPEITRFTDGNLYVWVPRKTNHTGSVD
jgi:hypothetical protein